MTGVRCLPEENLSLFAGVAIVTGEYSLAFQFSHLVLVLPKRLLFSFPSTHESNEPDPPCDHHPNEQTEHDDALLCLFGCHASILSTVQR